MFETTKQFFVPAFDAGDASLDQFVAQLEAERPKKDFAAAMVAVYPCGSCCHNCY